MKFPWLGPVVAVVAVAFIFIVNSAYVVDQTQQAIITEFGKPMGDPVARPGLHFRTPFIQQVNYFDKRILQWDGYSTEIPTKDKKFIWVDLTARWRIVDPLKFLTTVGNEANAQGRLDDIIDGISRDYITSNNLIEIVRSSNRILDIPRTEQDISADSEIEKVTKGRDAITREVVEKTRQAVSDFGIQIVDVQIKRINYVAQVRQKVFERMISERKRSAEKLRSEGQGIKADIEGQKEKELRRITSEAYKEARKIEGAADAEATKIYAEAYNKDPEFYSFMNTLDTYRETLSKDSTLVLSTDSEYLKYLKDQGNPVKQ
ncbi:MAG: protease modulator HflC [Candidatus Omnitrophica bacterium]|nr:protease modulator HflC [Candidatus Omnitrophota bacterium]